MGESSVVIFVTLRGEVAGERPCCLESDGVEDEIPSNKWTAPEPNLHVSVECFKWVNCRLRTKVELTDCRGLQTGRDPVRL